eukprot:c52291_g1_i1.p1 GENE.c52291_g1_i1~~c52291_g1_i1.p1  ORF type:complete len:906 (+),score=209.44 c52291_g1_i1:57-2774(+)
MSGNDSKYFQTNKKGEIPELKEELLEADEGKRKEAVKKVIAAMTIGKDVSPLFMNVISCMQTQNIEMKKLVYLYLMNYAKSQPDLAILAVNTFVKDTEHLNPLIRALAIRTMSCIRVDKIIDHLLFPLQTCLKDEDPYVRKTAAIAVAKLYDMSPELVEEQGFLDTLREMLGDANPMVVANCVAALTEIQETSGHQVFEIDKNVLHKLQAALNECTEWGQVFILDCLANYTPSKSSEAEQIIERVTPRFQHVNAAVVLSTVKVVMKYMEVISSQDLIKTYCKKMAPPLVTLLMSSEPEIQYVALRNINLIVQRRGQVLQGEVKVFFCKYNDPIYVKLEKLEIMVMLASERNIDNILMEFKEYATEVDIDFVRKSVRAIGRCAIKLERAAERCVKVLLDLIQTKVNYVVQEAIIVIKDIFRKYPNRYESTIMILCENLDTLDEPEAKASMIWIIGEYAERIDNADELLDSFLDNFKEEPAQVQLQLLTATVKLFLKKPANTQKMVQDVLGMATQEADNPDLRDRGYIYWRLLSTDPEAAKAVVLSEKPLISDDTSMVEPSLLSELIANISTLASIYHKPPEAFVDRPRVVLPKASQPRQLDDDTDEYTTELSGPNADMPANSSSGGVLDLLDLGMGGDTQPKPAAGGISSVADLFGVSSAPAPTNTGRGQFPPSVRTVVLEGARADGMQVSCCFVIRNGGLVADIEIENQSNTPLSGFMVQFNKNALNLKPTSARLDMNPAVIEPGQKAYGLLPVRQEAPVNGEAFGVQYIQIALKNNVKVYYFQDRVPLYAALAANGPIERSTFLSMWGQIPEHLEAAQLVQGLSTENGQEVIQKLSQTNIFHVATRQEGQKEILYLSAQVLTGQALLIELTFSAGTRTCRACLRCADPSIGGAFFESIQFLLQH